MTEESELDALAEGIDLAFTDPDPWFRDFFMRHLRWSMWRRVTILQSGLDASWSLKLIDSPSEK